MGECQAELGRSSSTWSRRHVVQQVARRAPGGLAGADAARRWVEQVADDVLAHPTVVRLVAPAPEAPADLCRRDGRSVYEAHGAPLFSTLATLAREQEVLDAAVAGREAQRTMAHPEDTDGAIALYGLDADQAEAVRRLTLHGESIVCLTGPAGAGKSRTMGAAAEAWADSGIAVRGLAVSAAGRGPDGLLLAGAERSKPKVWRASRRRLGVARPTAPARWALRPAGGPRSRRPPPGPAPGRR